MKKAGTHSSDQSERFKEAARELGCDESEERFEAALKVVAKQKPKGAEPSVSGGGKGNQSAKAQ